MSFPLLLYTYLAAEILGPLFASFIILNSVLVLGRLVPFLDMLIDFNIALSDFIRLCAYLTPQLFQFSIPMATMMGVIIGLTRLTNDGEIMAFKACGIGLYRMLPPVVIIGLSAAALTGLFTTRLMPSCNIAMEKLLFKLAKEKFDRGMREKRFSDAIGSVVLYADQINKENGEWQGVYAVDLRDRNAPVIILAQNGRLTTGSESTNLTLTLTNGSLHRVDGDITRNIQFNRYVVAMNVSSSIDRRPAAVLDKKSSTRAQLLRRAAQLDPGSEERASLLIEYHQRLALPVGCLILGLLGFPLAFLNGPGQRAVGMPAGLVLFILYFLLTTGADAASESLVLPASIAMWLPDMVYGLLTVYLLRSVAREDTAIHLEKAGNFGRRFFHKLRTLRKQAP